jgi:HK97 family phage prohead protease
MPASARTLQVVRKDASAAPAEAGPKVYTFRANDGDFDRYMDRNSVKGWKLENFNANPVILFNHDDGTGALFGEPALPIGKGRAYIEGNALMVDITFDQTDDFAKRIESKVDQGILSAVSVRYMMADGKFKVNEKGGFDSEEQELLEISVVTIPGNQRAVRVKALESERAEFIDAIADAVAKKLAAPKSAPVAEPVSEPVAVAAPAAEVQPEVSTAPDLDVDALVQKVWNHLKEQQ